MSIAVNKTGRPIAHFCSWPAYKGGFPPKVLPILGFGLPIQGFFVGSDGFYISPQ